MKSHAFILSLLLAAFCPAAETLTVPWAKVVTGKTTTAAEQASARTDLNADIKFSRAREWARNFRGLRSDLEIMSEPPVATVSAGTTSSFATGVTYSYTGSNVIVSRNKLIDDGSGRGISSGGTLTGGAKTSAGPTTLRFLTDAPEYEFAVGSCQLGSINVIEDGKLAYAYNPVNIPTTNANRFVKFSHGADAITYTCVQTQSVPSGGSGYAVGDTITWTIAGTGTQPIVSTVTSITSVTGPPAINGIVSGFQLKSGGLFTVTSTANLVQASTSGSGTGASTIPVFAPMHSSRKMREVQILYSAVSGLSTKGVRVDNLSRVLPFPVPINQPKFGFIGDSQLYGTYLTADGRRLAERMAWRLNVWDRHQINAMGGTGYAQASGSAPAWSDPLRLQDFADMDCDVYVFIGSQNGDDTIPTTQAAVTNTLNYLLTNKPNCLIVGIGNILCTGGVQTKAGFLAAQDQTRVRYIDNVSEKWFFDDGGGVRNTNLYLSSDGAHEGQDGLDFFEKAATMRVYNAVAEMTLPN